MSITSAILNCYPLYIFSFLRQDPSLNIELIQEVKVEHKEPPASGFGIINVFQCN